MSQDEWSLAHPTAHKAALLGEGHAAGRAFSKVEFLDLFDLNIDDVRDGYNALALYHLYLSSRTRARVLGSQIGPDHDQNPTLSLPGHPDERRCG
ncbi:hypothetical protein [Nonomuraea sp. NPDC049695]|uniref:hypothetical protein n=1 Tax=Nonomuraea sp. NPDC049695 TaxID=3154734 RepID=UPI00341236E7